MNHLLVDVVEGVVFCDITLRRCSQLDRDCNSCELAVVWERRVGEFAVFVKGVEGK